MTTRFILLFFLSIVNVFAGNMLLMSHYIPANDNMICNIEGELKSERMAMIIYPYSFKDAKISNNINGDGCGGHIVGSDVMLEISDLVNLEMKDDFTDEHNKEGYFNLKNYLNLRLAGFSADASVKLISNKTGYEWRGIKVTGVRDQISSMPKWYLNHREILAESSEVIRMNDHDVVRFFIVKEGKVLSSHSFDWRNLNSQENEQFARYFDQSLDEIEISNRDLKKEYLSLAQRLFSKYGIFWLSPMEIESVGEDW